MTKQRVVVLRLLHGGYLTRTGCGTNSPAHAVRFRPEDVQRFLAVLRPVDRNDPLWGVSLEWLPKRPQHSWITDEDLRAFMVTMKDVRLKGEADRLDRLAEGYLLQAKHATESAARFRAQAAKLRETIP